MSSGEPEGPRAEPVDLADRVLLALKRSSHGARYERLEKLGAGGMGTVYRGRDRELGRDVALKVLGSGLGGNRDALARFRREAESLGRLRHTHIAEIHEMIEDPLTIVLELVEGVPLTRLMAERRLERRAALALVEKVARALQHAHENGVVHRDLKPDNVIVTPTLEPKLVDFGIARLADAETVLTATGSLLGTPAYMAPEQARGDTRSIDARTDVYALGVLLHECLTGRTPFEGRVASVLSRIPTEAPAPPSSYDPTIPPGVDALVLRALEKDPERRHATAGLFADELHGWLEHPSTDLPPGRARRHAPLFVGAALVAGAGLVFARGGLAPPSLPDRRDPDAGRGASLAPVSSANGVAPSRSAELERQGADFVQRGKLRDARRAFERAAALGAKNASACERLAAALDGDPAAQDALDALSPVRTANESLRLFARPFYQRALAPGGSLEARFRWSEAAWRLESPRPDLAPRVVALWRELASGPTDDHWSLLERAAGGDRAALARLRAVTACLAHLHDTAPDPSTEEAAWARLQLTRFFGGQAPGALPVLRALFEPCPDHPTLAFVEASAARLRGDRARTFAAALAGVAHLPAPVEGEPGEIGWLARDLVAIAVSVETEATPADLDALEIAAGHDPNGEILGRLAGSWIRRTPPDAEKARACLARVPEASLEESTVEARVALWLHDGETARALAHLRAAWQATRSRFTRYLFAERLESEGAFAELAALPTEDADRDDGGQRFLARRLRALCSLGRRAEAEELARSSALLTDELERWRRASGR